MYDDGMTEEEAAEKDKWEAQISKIMGTVVILIGLAFVIAGVVAFLSVVEAGEAPLDLNEILHLFLAVVIFCFGLGCIGGGANTLLKFSRISV